MGMASETALKIEPVLKGELEDTEAFSGYNFFVSSSQEPSCDEVFVSFVNRWGSVEGIKVPVFCVWFCKK